MAYTLSWLAEVLKEAGLKVAEVPGWKERGRGDVGQIRGVICHHTAGTAKGNMPSLDVIVKGRENLHGPLAQLGLGRDGTYYVIAAGKCNHAGAGSWNGLTNGNLSFIGIEAENCGTTEDFPWPAIQMDAYQRGVAAILKHLGRGPEFCAGHKEYAPSRKPDPTFDMLTFRDGVGAFLRAGVPVREPIPAVEPAAPSGKSARRTLRRGSTDPLVESLQQRFGIDERITTAGGAGARIFGPNTEAKVREFQRKHELVPDGIVGPKTWRTLDENP